MAEPSCGAWAWIGDNYEGLLIVGAVVGLALATWRAGTAKQQAKAAENAAEAAIQQVEVSRESFIDRQFQVGVELFKEENTTTRLGGIFALTNLMQRYPDIYHTSVMRLFAAFLADPPLFEDSREADFGNPAICEIIDIINETGEEEREFERADHFDLSEYLRETDFPFVNGKIRPRPTPYAIAEQPFFNSPIRGRSGRGSGAAPPPDPAQE